MSLPIVQVSRPRSYPPRVTAHTKRFWDDLSQGVFQANKCFSCNRLTFPPKPFCPHCWSRDVGWVELSGRGRLYAETVVHAAPGVFASEAPYRVGIVDLEEGLRIATRIVRGDVPPKLDAPVELIVQQFEDGPLFAARPVAGPADDGEG